VKLWTVGLAASVSIAFVPHGRLNTDLAEAALAHIPLGSPRK